MIRKGFLLMLCLSMLASVLCACADDGAAKETAAPTGSTSAPVETTVATEPTEPDDGSIKFYYDDRISFDQLGGTKESAVEIKEQEVTSSMVGSDTLDSAVLYYDEQNAQLIAVGTGTATVSVDGKDVLVRVRPAPISLFMITGHSLGAGQCGNGAQSVVCEPGQAYSCHKTATFTEATPDMGIGFGASVKPEGIDAFAPGGGGTIGEGSALAWTWNNLTGDKVWVLNAAVGGSVIPEWHKGQKYYEPAVAMYKAAATVLCNEAKAGHYVVKNTAVIYHSGANFEYKNVEFTDEVMEYWYDSMINGFKNDLAADFNCDGTPEMPQGIGIIPHGAASFKQDKPANYYVAFSDKYENCFILSKTVYYWRTDELLQANFPAIEYETQSEPVVAPKTTTELKAEDKVHLGQAGYNACGLMIGENLYNYFRTDVKLESLEILDENGNEVKDEISFKKVGQSEKLIALTEPCYASDFTIELSENLELISPFVVKAKAEGEGYIKITKDGEVIREIPVKVGK